MAMRNALGKYAGSFVARKGGSTADVSGIIRLSDITLLQNLDQFGNPTAAGYQAALQVLEPYMSDDRVQKKALEFDQSRVQFGNRQIDAELDLAIFDQSIEDALDDASRRFAGDPVGLIQANADIHTAAEDLYVQDLLPRILDKFEAGDAIDSKYFTKSDELEASSRIYATAANAISFGEFDNPDAYGFVIQTNPQTGKIVNTRFQPIDSLNKKPEGFSKSDTTIKVGGSEVPIYLNWASSGNQRVSRLGDRKFTAARGEGSQRKDEFNETVLKQDFPALAGILPGGVQPSKERSINLSQLLYDEFDIPENTVLKTGSGQLMYLGREGVLSRVDDPEVLARVLNETGRNGAEEIVNAFRVTENYLANQSNFKLGPTFDESFFATAAEQLGGGRTVALPGGPAPAVAGGPVTARQTRQVPQLQSVARPFEFQTPAPLQSFQSARSAAEKVETGSQELVSGVRRFFQGRSGDRALNQ